MNSNPSFRFLSCDITIAIKNEMANNIMSIGNSHIALITLGASTFLSTIIFSKKGSPSSNNGRKISKWSVINTISKTKKKI